MTKLWNTPSPARFALLPGMTLPALAFCTAIGAGLGTLGLSMPAFGLEKPYISGSRHVQDVLHKVPRTNLTKQGGEAKLSEAELAGAIGQSVSLPSGVQFNRGDGYRLDLAGHNDVSSTFHSYIDGFKVCGASIKSVAVGEETYLVGKAPSAEPRGSFAQSDFSESAELIEAIKDRWPGRAVVMDASAPCLYPLEDGEYRPSHEVWFAVDNRLHYRGYHDGQQFLELHPVAFDVDGTAKIYEKNSKDGTIRVFDLLGLTTSGRLGNQYFVTRMDDTSNETRVFSNTNEFFFESDPTSSAFAETSVFTNANRILGFFASIGYTGFGPRPILLNMHPAIKANAQYIPSNTSNPVISIGDGESGRLENLTTDMDVVNHEFGHHVVFGSLRDTGRIIDGTRQVLVMHEALADYFAFAFSGDSCLGESICPSGSRLCALENRCLRSADTLMTMTSGPSTTEEHIRGQFLSAFLWDIRNESTVTNQTFDTMVLKAVGLLDTGSGYQDMLLKLHITDRDTNSGAYCELIKKHAKQRQLDQYLSYDCGTGQYRKLAIDSGGSSTSRSSSRRSGLFSFCGTVTGQSASAVSLIYLLAGLLPMLYLGRRKSDEVDSSDV